MLIYICEDTASDCLRLKHHLSTYSKEIEASFEIEAFSSSCDLLNIWNPNGSTPSIIFIDIYMEGMNGIDLAKSLRNKGYSGAIIFTTSSLEHAMQSYEVDASYYLQKPYTHEDFIKAMKRCDNIIKDSMLHFVGCSRGKEYSIPYAEILYFETGNHNVILHTKKQAITFQRSMNSIIEEFQNIPSFISCGKSYFINMNYVDKQLGTDLIMSDGYSIQIPVRVKNDVINAITEWKKN